MVFLRKIVKKALFITLLLSLLLSKFNVYAQVSADLQAELGKYETLVAGYKNKKEYKMAGYYLYKIAGIYLGAGEHQNAIDNYLESADYYELLGNYNNKKKIYSNVAFVYADMGQLKNAKKYYNKSLEISRRLNNRKDISASLMEVASIEIYLQDFTSAQTNLNEALNFAKILKDAILLRTCYLLLHQLHKAKGNTTKSNQYYNSYLEYDKIVNGERTAKENSKEEKIKKEEKVQILSDKNESQAMQYELLEIKIKSTEDSLVNTLAVKEDAFNRIEGRSDLIRKINKNLKQDSKSLKEEIKQKQQIINHQNRQLLIAVIEIIALVLFAAGIILAFSKKSKAYEQLEQKMVEKKDNLKSLKP